LSGILVIRKSEDSIMVTPPHYLASGITAWIGNPLLGRRGDARLFISIHCFNSDPFQFHQFQLLYAPSAGFVFCHPV
jgi:hypothetical protein